MLIISNNYKFMSFSITFVLWVSLFKWSKSMGKEKSKKSFILERPLYQRCHSALQSFALHSIVFHQVRRYKLCLQLPLLLLCKVLHLPRRLLFSCLHVKIYQLDISSYISHCNPKSTDFQNIILKICFLSWIHTQSLSYNPTPQSWPLQATRPQDLSSLPD